MARRWAVASHVRAFLGAVEEAVPPGERHEGFVAWLRWANDKAAALGRLNEPRKIAKMAATATGPTGGSINCNASPTSSTCRSTSATFRPAPAEGSSLRETGDERRQVTIARRSFLDVASGHDERTPELRHLRATDRED